MLCSCKKIAACIARILLSHFGVLLLIIAYLVGGGWLFMYLEASNEISACFDSMAIYYQKLNDTTTRAVMISQAGYNTSYLLDQVVSLLVSFSGDVFALSVSPTMNCSTLGTVDNQQNWNLANTIFFCATLVTTIGYGNICPVTMWGRITCIVYSFIGIPLMLIFLSNFGVVLANAFRFTYFNLCCCRCFLKRQKEPEIEITKENFKSIGNPDAVDCEKNEMCVTELEDNNPPKMLNKMDEETEIEDTEVITIPIIVITMFLAFYMFLGAVLFQIWEDWDPVAGMYFAFITVSTIGLGDLYPTKGRLMNMGATVELLAAAVYCLFGLAVLSMCLSLIQDEISCKLHWLGEKIGLKSKDEHNMEENNENDTFDDETKPIIIQQPLMMSMHHLNDAYNEDVFEKTEDQPSGLYPKLH